MVEVLQINNNLNTSTKLDLYAVRVNYATSICHNIPALQMMSKHVGGSINQLNNINGTMFGAAQNLEKTTDVKDTKPRLYRVRSLQH